MTENKRQQKHDPFTKDVEVRTIGYTPGIKSKTNKVKGVDYYLNKIKNFVF